MEQEPGWFENPNLLEEIGKLYRLHKQLSSSAMRSNAEIAVIIDEPSTYYMVQTPDLILPLLIEQVVGELSFIGASFDLLLTSDLHLARPYRLYIIPCAYGPLPEARKALRSLYGLGRTILWLHAPGLMTGGKVSQDAASELVGMRLELCMIGGPAHVHLTAREHELTHGLSPGFRYGTDRRLAPILKVVDEGALILGEVRCTSLDTLDGVSWPLHTCYGAGLAVKEVDGAKVIFSSAGPVPVPLLRNIARYAGVRLHDDAGNVVYTSEGLIAVHMVAGGDRTVVNVLRGRN